MDPSTPSVPVAAKRGRTREILVTILLGVVMLLVTGILLASFFIVPRFEAIFKDFGSKLPPMTEMVIAIADFLRAFWFIAIPAGLLSASAIVLVTWNVDWRAGLVVTLLLGVAVLVCWGIVIFALYSPLTVIIQDVRQSGQ